MDNNVPASLVDHRRKPRFAKAGWDWAMASKRSLSKREPPPSSFSALVADIRHVHAQCAAQATRAVNISLTFRNWLIGAHIHHYELQGADRATYGDKLLHNLAEQLTQGKVSNCDRASSTAICASIAFIQALWGRCPHNSPSCSHLQPTRK
ncbi:DUF1016 N-terminal domain-containing protein [Acidovorax sp. NPDC077693]|uniref:DUF1016 N-terminal domain-containing protein n=1 Tax=unclassified Acidovorax TaxID=2684926 RepID=UPI0037C788A8